MELRVTRCRRDGLLNFPPDEFGCRNCGSRGDDLEAISVAAKGIVLDTVTIHRHRGQGPTAPFIIASIQVNDGLIIRALADPGTARGDHVRGRIHSSGSTGQLVWFGSKGGDQ
jgi:uncharacterized OB-fold protein